MKLTVNQPGDKFEQEADQMSNRVLQEPTPLVKNDKMLPASSGSKIQKKALNEDKVQKAEMKEDKVQKAEMKDDKVQKAEVKDDKVQKKESGGSNGMTAQTQSAIQNKTTGGQPLSNDARSYMEPRLGADFSNVRVHSDTESAGLSNQLSARAFTYQNHVFFSRDQYQPGTGEGKQLLAHELTHTIQQGHSPQHNTTVSTTSSSPQVQRLGMQDALDYFADKAYHIPGFRLLTILLGFNPINMRSVDRNAANLLRGLIELIPGGHFITQALDNHGVINKAAAWIEQKITILGDIGGDIVAGLKKFIDSLSWTDIFDLGGVWDRAKRIFTDPIVRLIDFGKTAVIEILKMVKDAVLKPLAALAQGTRGYDLLKAVLGEDPITGEPVPRNADTLIGGFMKLIGQDEVWENIKKGNAIARAWAWFQGALSGLMGMVRAIPGKIINTLKSLTFQDIITVVGALGKIIGAFVNIAVDFISWGLKQVISLLEIIFSVVAPGAVPYIKKAQGAFEKIIKNPIGFVGNLVRAGKLGFQKFADNILTHLKTALIKWITGPLGDAGVYIPKAFTLIEIIKLVLSVLGLTWQNIRSKLVKIIPEPVLVVIEKTASVLVTLVKDGPVAAWQEIKSELTELKDQMIAKITEMVTTEIVKAAVMKLVSMLNPAGAIIQAIIAIYNTITFFIEKINQIAAVVASFIDSVSEIASGAIENAAKKVEQTMANTLVIIIGFLAKFAGLGGIPDKLVGIIKKIRAPIDKGLDKIVGWLGGMLKKLGAAAKEKVAKLLSWWTKKAPVSGGGESHTVTFQGSGPTARVIIQSSPMPPGAFLQKIAADNSVKPKDSTNEIAASSETEGEIATKQKNLIAIEEKVKLGAPSAEADIESGALDILLTKLAGIISSALTKWKVGNKKITGVSIPRGSFTHTAKVNIAAQHKNKGDLKKNKAGEKISLQSGLDRRHVVSSADMAGHYEQSLNGKLVTDGKVLIEKRGSVTEALTVVSEPLDEKAIQTAAKARYQKFFGYARNIFIGDSSENRSIQQHLDDGHPELVGPKLQNHVDHLKRGWTLDSGFAPTPVKPG